MSKRDMNRTQSLHLFGEAESELKKLGGRFNQDIYWFTYWFTYTGFGCRQKEKFSGTTKSDNLVALAKRMQSNFDIVHIFHMIVDLNIIIN